MNISSIAKIMLVDDNVIDRLVHRRLLEIHKIGESVAEYSSADEAINFLTTNRQDVESLPDLILLDIMMPGMNGFDFMVHFSKLKDQFAKQPLVFMLSSTNDESDIRKVRNNADVVKMLNKPFSPESLANSILKL